MKLENVTVEHLGKSKSIISTQTTTTIIWGAWETLDIDARIRDLKTQYQNTQSKYDMEKIAERIARLAGWVAVIKVWAASEVEMKEKKLRIEDALNATRAAVAEWVVAGWWIALLRASVVLDDIDLWSEDQNIWADIVREALFYPLRQIVMNSGRDAEIVLDELLKEDDINYGYDAANEEFTDMLEAGIIDPKKVERIALQEAISLAWMFLTTESAIVEIPKKWWDTASMPDMSWMWWMPWMGMM